MNDELFDDSPLVVQESVPATLSDFGPARWAVPYTLREAAQELVKGATDLGREVLWETLATTIVRQHAGGLVVTLAARTVRGAVTESDSSITVLSDQAGQRRSGGADE
jgi:hypothetical protein